jgi:hypothetical protein
MSKKKFSLFTFHCSENDQGYVPAYYLFDREAKLRSFAAGERGLDLLKATLDRVMAAAAQTANS